MRLGFSLGSVLSIDQIMECSRILSNYNPDSIWIPETWGMDCFSVMSSVSQVTEKPKIGSSIANIYSRSPSLIAMTAASIDILSGGRLILGLGTSSQAIVENWHGIEFKEPVTRMREYVKIIRLVLTGKKVNYQGDFFHLRDFDLLIKPHRRNIPIYVAAVNQRMVELTWDIADGVIFYLRPVTELNKTIKKMQTKREIDVTCQIITCVSEDADKAIKRAKKTISFYVSVGKIYRQFLKEHGFEKECNDIFSEYNKTGFKENHNLVPDEMVNALTICGTPNDVKEQIKRFVNAGVNLPILQFNPVGDVVESFNLVVSTLFGDTK